MAQVQALCAQLRGDGDGALSSAAQVELAQRLGLLVRGSDEAGLQRKAAAVESGAAAHLVACLESATCCEHVCAAALTLTVLSSGTDGRADERVAALLAAGLAAQLVSAMRRVLQEERQRVVQQGRALRQLAWCLTNITFGGEDATGAKTQAARAGAVEVLLHALAQQQRHDASADGAQEYLLWALGNICAGEDERVDEAVAASLFPPQQEGQQLHPLLHAAAPPSSEAVRCRAAVVVGNLAQAQAAHATRLVRGGMLVALADSLHAAQHTRTKQRVAQAVTNLTYGSDREQAARQAGAHSVGLPAALVAALGSGVVESPAREALAQALGNLSVGTSPQGHSYAQAAVEAGALPQLLGGVQHASEGSELEAHLVALLCVTSTKDPAGENRRADRAVAEGLFEVVVAVLSCAASERVRELAVWNLVNATEATNASGRERANQAVASGALAALGMTLQASQSDAEAARAATAIKHILFGAGPSRLRRAQSAADAALDEALALCLCKRLEPETREKVELAYKLCKGAAT